MFNKKKSKEDKKTRNNLFVNKFRIFVNNQKQYKIWKSKYFIGLILLIVFSYLFIVSIIQIPGFSTINSYTMAMLFGYYSYFFYIAFIFYGLCLLFQIDIKIDKFIAKKFNKKLHFSWFSFLFLVIGIALIYESINNAVKFKTIFPGIGAFKFSFTEWWKSFTNNFNEYGTPALPNINNSGIIVTFCMSLIVSWSGYVVSIIIGLLFIGYFLMYVFHGSIINKIRNKNLEGNKKDVKRMDFQEYKTKVLDLSFEDNEPLMNEIEGNEIKPKTTTITISSNELFSDEKPFDEDEKVDFIKEKTMELNKKHNKTVEFDLEHTIKKQIINERTETFDFELDIFDTGTNLMEFDNEKNN